MLIRDSLSRLIILFAILFSCDQLQAQGRGGAYGYKVNVQKYQGLRYRLAALIRAEGADDSSAAMLWTRVDKPNGSGMLRALDERPVRSREWKTYQMEGIIDSGAVYLAFGALCAYNGKFFYDDFKVEVATRSNEWITIFKDDFESGPLNFQPGFISGNRGINRYFKAELLTDKRKIGARALAITGDSVPNYGINSKVGKYANVNGIKLYYEIYGEGPPLLVLHGNGGSISSAFSFYPRLVKKYKVIAVDSRAQGKSTDTDQPLTYDQMASDVNALLEQLKIDSVNIWGQSDGAILGLLLAKDYPKKVKRVVAFGSNIQHDSAAVFPWALSASSRIIKESKDPKEKKLNLLMRDYPNLNYSDLSKIEAPVLVVAGDRDVIRPEHTLKIFQHLPNSQMCIIPGATHAASWEQMDLFMQLLETFFDKPFAMPDTKDWY